MSWGFFISIDSSDETRPDFSEISNLNSIYIRRSHLCQHPGSLHLPQFELGFRREDTFFEAHHGKAVLKLTQLGRNVESRLQLHKPTGKVRSGCNSQGDAA